MQSFWKKTYILEYYNNDDDDYNDETYISLFNYHNKERINKIKNNNFNLLSKTVVFSSNKISITELYNELTNKNLTSLESFEILKWKHKNIIFRYEKLPNNQYEINYSGNFNYLNNNILNIIEKYNNEDEEEEIYF